MLGSELIKVRVNFPLGSSRMHPQQIHLLGRNLAVVIEDELPLVLKRLSLAQPARPVATTHAKTTHAKTQEQGQGYK